MSRTFQIDVLACPGCGGRLRLIATIEHRAVIEKILRYLGLSGELPEPDPPRHPPWLPGFERPASLRPSGPAEQRPAGFLAPLGLCGIPLLDALRDQQPISFK